MGPTWDLSVPRGPHVGPMDLAIRVCNSASRFRNLGIFSIHRGKMLPCQCVHLDSVFRPRLWCKEVQSRKSIQLIFPGRFERNLRKVIFKLILMICGWGIFCKIALRWMSMDLTYNKSTLVQVMAWCSQATSHYVSQCWPRSTSPYGVARP